MQASTRAAAVQLLRDYADNAQIKLQVYPARPKTIRPPTAFVDRLTESVTYLGPENHQRTVRATVVVLHGDFDGKEAADQKDAFVDGFLAYTASRYHAAGANTLLALVGTDDLPAYVPEWMAPELQRTYYATEIALEGYAES